MPLDPVLKAAKRFCADALQAGAVAIDATVGNGHDTLFLAQSVGPSGRVYGFDVQQEAIERTRTRLADAGQQAPVSLIRASHDAMDAHLPPADRGRVAAVMFNLGYLPGGDTSCITTPEGTVAALDVACQLLRPGGVITVVQYVGHAGGRAEAEAVTAWAAALDQQRYQALTYRFINQVNDPPRLLVISRRSRRG